MFEPSVVKKTLALFVIGLFLGAGIIPTINGNKIIASSDDHHSIGIDTATQVARGKLSELCKIDFSMIDSEEITRDTGTLLCYVFNLKPQGYIVVSASYDLPPVIAYSLTSNFKDTAESNLLRDILIADVTLRLENIQKLPEKMIQERHILWDAYLQEKPMITAGFEQWPAEGTTSTGGWVETLWTQEAPYNNFCPLDKANGGRSIAGCPSLAMAMILDYHKTTNNVMFNDSDDYYHNYGGNNYWIDNDYVSYNFPSFPTLNGYLATLCSHYQNQTPTTDTDAAALTFACGVAAKQVYGSQGSGTFGVNQALVAYRKFHCTTCKLLLDTDSNVYGRLAKNMIDALPAHLAVVDEGWTMGHNLVVDGYNTDDFYHLNFGWGGAYNGWYLLPDEVPYGLTVLEGVIVDIMYDHVGPQVRCNGSIHLTNITPSTTITESFTVDNAGTPGSLLNWEITSFPDWGTWTFTPSSGTSLTPEQGSMTINVSVVAPAKKNREYSGYIKVTNTDNPTDCYIVQITLATPYKFHSFLLDILQALMERFPHAFPMLRLLLNQ
ncbi:MAG: C10 family peptidase [Euryarchaeota archaeon]|nr:C10 family peptidase [Euryarchaeota archaeon]